MTNAAPKTSETFILDHIRVLADGRFVALRPTTRLRRALYFGRSAPGDPDDLFARLLRDRIDVVLAEYGPTAVAAMDSCRRAEVPLLAHFHGFDVSKKSVLEAHRISYKRMFEHVRAIIAVSEFMQRQLVSLGASPSKIEIVPCGVDTTLFSGADPGVSTQRLLMVGRLVDKKQPILVLRAFTAALTHCPDAVLTVIGDGPLRSAVEGAVMDLGIAQSVHLRGACSREDVRAEMLRSRAVVQHSRVAPSGDMEGLPVSLMEAAATGLPVISTMHAGIPEVVLHEKTGLLGAEGDVDAMANSMVRLLEDPTLAARFGASAAQHARFHFDQRVMHGRLRALLGSAAISA
ncbi:MAG: glycosyltransferase [Actinomycetes bacterium]